MLKHHNKRLDEISVSRANFLLPFRSEDNWIWNGKVETKGGKIIQTGGAKEMPQRREIEDVEDKNTNTRIFTFLPDFVRFATSMNNFLI